MPCGKDEKVDSEEGAADEDEGDSEEEDDDDSHEEVDDDDDDEDGHESLVKRLRLNLNEQIIYDIKFQVNGSLMEIKWKGGQRHWSVEVQLRRGADNVVAILGEFQSLAQKILVPFPLNLDSSEEYCIQIYEAQSDWFTSSLKIDRPEPLLANNHNLLQDVHDLLNNDNWRRREADANLILPVYNDLGRNLILDIHMLFEEHLQQEIAKEQYFMQQAELIVDFIHKKFKFPSVDECEIDDGVPMDLRDARLGWFYNHLSGVLESEKTLRCWSESRWRRIELANSKNKGYVQLFKMLMTQYPYFDGSVEYKYPITSPLPLEYWVYHLSTLIKDPTRFLQHTLPTPLRDYRTYSAGRFPFHNQRNLGISIPDASWEQLPTSLRGAITSRIKSHFAKGHKYMITNKKGCARLVRSLVDSPRDEASLKAFWDGLDADARKVFFNDVVKLCRSNAQRHETINVAGVWSNVLEDPKIAADRYRQVLDNHFPRTESLPAKIFIVDNKHFPSDAPLSKGDILNDFVKHHSTWYKTMSEQCLPIIGGISDQTLGCLNLYADALNNPNKPTFQMEVLRAIMLGVFIGTKRRHSYGEVMTASVGVTGLGYEPKGFYHDVFNTKVRKIERAAINARTLVLEQIDEPPKTSVLHITKERWGQHFPRVQGILKDYVNGQKQEISIQKLDQLLQD